MHRNYILLYLLIQWLLHVSVKCHPQGATIFPCWDTSVNMVGDSHRTKTEPTYRRAIQWTEKVHYQVQEYIKYQSIEWVMHLLLLYSSLPNSIKNVLLSFSVNIWFWREDFEDPSSHTHTKIHEFIFRQTKIECIRSLAIFN
jgi:hypothetical protein